MITRGVILQSVWPVAKDDLVFDMSTAPGGTKHRTKRRPKRRPPTGGGRKPSQSPLLSQPSTSSATPLISPGPNSPPPTADSPTALEQKLSKSPFLLNLGYCSGSTENSDYSRA